MVALSGMDIRIGDAGGIGAECSAPSGTANGCGCVGGDSGGAGRAPCSDVPKRRDQSDRLRRERLGALVASIAAISADSAAIFAARAARRRRRSR
jgi:hypothetical protein